MNKNIMMAISGGYDSTYLLIKNLQNGDNVYPVYVHVRCIYPLKQIIEINIVRKLIRKLRKKYTNLHELIETEIHIEPIRNIFSTQPIFWMLALFNEVKKKSHIINIDEVHIGYIKPDGAISHIPEIKAYWKILFSFSVNHQNFSIPKLRFPLIKYYKKQIIDKLRNYDEEILSFCWSCENPRIIRTKRCKDNTIEMYIEACGFCQPCDHLQDTENISFDLIKKYRIIFNINDFYKSLGNYEKRAIKNMKHQHLPSRLYKIEEADNKTIENINKQLIKKRTGKEYKR